MITFSSRRFHITPKPMFLYQHRSPCIQPPMSRPVTGNRSDGLKIGKASVGIPKMMCSSFFATIFYIFNLEVQPPILKIGWKLRSTFFPLKILRAYHLKETTIFMMMLTSRDYTYCHIDVLPLWSVDVDHLRFETWSHRTRCFSASASKSWISVKISTSTRR